jgi:hypothetical protein
VRDFLSYIQMSLLGTPVYANPSTPLWLSAAPGGPGGNATFTNLNIGSAVYFLDGAGNQTAAINNNNNGTLALSGNNAIDFKQVGAAGGNSSLVITPLGGTDTFTTGNIDCATLSLNNSGGAAVVGTSTLSNGTATVSTTASDSTCYIFLQRRDINASTAIGELRITQRNAGNFVVVSASTPPTAPTTTETGDLSTFDWMIINPA